jgi:hypothetical protein
MHEQEGASAGTEVERRRSTSGIRCVRRVLLLARMPGAVNALTEVLGEAGYLVRVARDLDGADGVVSSFAPHALLVDLDAWGPEHRLRWCGLASGHCLTHAPVVGMALDVLAADRALAALLLKPIDLEVLLATVAQIVDERLELLAGSR